MTRLEQILCVVLGIAALFLLGKGIFMVIKVSLVAGRPKSKKTARRPSGKTHSSVRPIQTDAPLKKPVPVSAPISDPLPSNPFQKLKDLLCQTDPSPNDAERTFMKDFHECCQEWNAIRNLQGACDRSQQIRSCYYPSGKMASRIQDFVEYAAGQLYRETSAEKILLRGFNGCVNFIFLDFEEMQKTQKESQSILPAVQTTDLPASFLYEAVSWNGAINQLATTYLTCCQAVRENGISGISKSLHTQLEQLLTDIKEGVVQLSEAKQKLQARKARMDREIQQSQALYAALETILTAERKKALQDTSASQEELTRRYQELASMLDENVRKPFAIP